MVGLVLAIILAGVIGGVVINRFNKVAGTIVQQDPRHQRNVITDDDTPNPDTDTNTDTQPVAEPIELPDILNKPFTVLLIGVDKRDQEEEGVRSDTLIVVHVHPKGEWASMLSIPRDSVVMIPKLGQQKINYAYTYGYYQAESLYGDDTPPAAAGGAFAAETVEEFLDLRIDYIAQVDFRGFERLVDMIGGIKVNVAKPILDAEYPTENFGFERIYIPAGLQVFDGLTALRYARSRHSGTDFARSQRQQQVLRAFLEELQQRGILDQVDMLPQMVENVQEHVSTTLPIGEFAVIRGLAHLAQTIHPEDVVQLSINPDTVGIIQEAGSDIYWNRQDIIALVEQLKLGPAAKTKQARIQVQNGTERHGLATRVTTLLGNQGYDMVLPDDAPTSYEHTMIVDYTGDLSETCEELATLLAIQSRYVYSSPPPKAPPKPLNTDIVLIVGEDYQEY
jgi:LCP family protein required for cell wall assembly